MGNFINKNQFIPAKEFFEEALEFVSLRVLFLGDENVFVGVGKGFYSRNKHRHSHNRYKRLPEAVQKRNSTRLRRILQVPSVIFADKTGHKAKHKLPKKHIMRSA